jgi:hypothetical protein
MQKRMLAALALIAVLGACSDSTGPEDFDPTTTDTKAQAVLSALNNNDGLNSVAVLGRYWAGLPALQAALATAPYDPAQVGETQVRLQTVEALRPSLSSVPSLAIFPADLLGAVFVFDPDSARYVLDPERQGPTDGIRLVLYAVDPVLQQILEPVQEVGHLDFIDVSTPATDAVQIVAVVNNVTFLDYTAGVTVTTSSITLSADGYLSNGSAQLDFDLSLTATATAGSLDYQLSNGDGEIRLEASFDADDSGSATLTLSSDGDTVVMSVTITPSTISGQVTYNGDVAVTVSGTPDDPVFARPDGTPLTQNEIAALLAFGDIIGDLFDIFDNLLFPAALVLAFD